MTFDLDEILPTCAKDVLARLEQELPAYLTYHNVSHTREVIEWACFLAEHEELSAADVELLLIAAAFHDVGYIHGRENHEEHSSRAAGEALEAAGCYSAFQINSVRQLILETKLVETNSGRVQLPTSPLACCLCDADLANFGQEVFLRKTELVRLESKQPATKTFYTDVLTLLEQHRWKTKTAQRFWEETKQQNIIKLKQLVAGNV